VSAAITVTRTPAIWRDRLRAYAIVVDGDAKGSIRGGETTTIEVDPGRHRVRTKIDWCRSADVEFELRERDEAILLCRPNGSVVSVLLYVTIWCTRYLDLQLVRIERQS
jgi:hypothetical protein